MPISPLPRPRAAFEATTPADVQAGLGAPKPIPGNQVRLDVPDIATQPGAVAVRVDTTMSGVTQVAVLAHRALFPLAALLRPDGALGPYEVVVAIDRTSRVTALVQADGKWYSVSREVKVAAQSW